MLTNPAAANRPRKRLNANEVRQILEHQEASGSSLLKYCRDHELPYKTIAGRRRKWRGPLRAQDSAATAFVPVEVKVQTSRVPATTPSASVLNASAMEIHLRHQRAIWVREDFNATALQRLVAVLEATPC